MEMADRRTAKRGKQTAAGSVELELKEVQKLQGSNRVDGFETITVSCCEFLTIICC